MSPGTGWGRASRSVSRFLGPVHHGLLLGPQGSTSGEASFAVCREVSQQLLLPFKPAIIFKHFYLFFKRESMVPVSRGVASGDKENGKENLKQTP